MFPKLAVLIFTITLILNQVFNSIEISSDEEHSAAAGDNIAELMMPPVPDISKHKNINLLASTSDCGIYPIKKRIFNGIKTDLFEFPWMALLSYEDTLVDRFDGDRNFKCAGTIINDRYILTAAHCIVQSSNYQLVGVRVGEHNINSNPDCETEGKNISVCADPVQDIEVEDRIAHQNYSKIHRSNNIGLLRLRTPIQFKRSVWPICLPIIKEYKIENFTNTRLIITGWGATTLFDDLNMDLLKAEVSVVSEKECKRWHERNSQIIIDHKYLCAGGPEGDTCTGDSGGPLQGTKLLNNDLQYVQYGISSFGRACGRVPSVYTRIDYYLDWILDNIKV